MNGLKANLAKKPDGGDRPQAGAIVAGECDIALGNTYYVGLMRTNEKDPKEKEWGNAHQRHLPDLRERLHPCQHFRRRAGQERAEPRQRRQADPVPGEPQGAAGLCRAELRISGRAGPGAVRDGQVLRRAQGRHAAARRHRQESARRPPRWSTASASTMARAAKSADRIADARAPRARPFDMTRLALPADGRPGSVALAPGPPRLKRQAAGPSRPARGCLCRRRAGAAAGRRRFPMSRCRAAAEDWPHLVRNVLPGASRDHAFPADRWWRPPRRPSASPRPGWWSPSTSRCAGRSPGRWCCRSPCRPIWRPTPSASSSTIPARCSALVRALFGFATVRDYWFPDIRSTPGARLRAVRRALPLCLSDRARRLPDARPQHRRRRAHARARGRPRCSSGCCCRWRGRRSWPAWRWC